jgi:hypothetical protein
MKHPFSYTLGIGPYKWVGSYNLGEAISCLNAGNISAYNSSLACAPKVERGIGTCAHCGHAIMMVQIVRTGDGKLYGVGSDCILKVYQNSDIENVSEMERELKRLKREAGQTKRENQRLTIKKECEKLTQENKEKLSKLPHPSESFKNKTAYDYCIYYLSSSHTLNGYKFFKEKILIFLKSSPIKKGGE